MKNHVQYENTLAKVAKNYNPKDCISKNLSIKMIEEFIVQNQREYEKEQGYLNDLDYAYYICNSVVNSILNQVSKNESLREKRAS